MTTRFLAFVFDAKRSVSPTHPVPRKGTDGRGPFGFIKLLRIMAYCGPRELVMRCIFIRAGTQRTSLPLALQLEACGAATRVPTTVMD